MKLIFDVYECDYNTGEPTDNLLRTEVLAVEGGFFVWDGCHKIYTVTTSEDWNRLAELAHLPISPMGSLIGGWGSGYVPTMFGRMRCGAAQPCSPPTS